MLPQLLESPRVGDHLEVRHDVLAEVGREIAGLPPTWCYVPAGTRGRLIGWRDRPDDHRAIVDVHGAGTRLIVFVGEGHVEPSTAPVVAPVRRRSRRADPALR